MKIKPHFHVNFTGEGFVKSIRYNSPSIIFKFQRHIWILPATFVFYSINRNQYRQYLNILLKNKPHIGEKGTLDCFYFSLEILPKTVKIQKREFLDTFFYIFGAYRLLHCNSYSYFFCHFLCSGNQNTV